MREKHLNRIMEFFLVGLGMGIAEDLIAVRLVSGISIDLWVIGIVSVVALPFAVFSELIVDREDFSFLRKK